MRLTARFNKLLLFLLWPALAQAEPAYLVSFDDGLRAVVNFTAGPAVSEDSRFESLATVMIYAGPEGPKRVKGVVFDATMEMGSDSHSLSDDRAPIAEEAGDNVWGIGNIFFTMERNGRPS